MKKRIRLFLIPMLLSQGLMASILSPEEALQRVNGSVKNIPAVRSGDGSELVYTVYSSTGVPSLYVFDNKEGRGSLIVSASTNTKPLLGYTDVGGFSASEMPAPLKYWLDRYGEQISEAETSGALRISEIAIDYPSEWTFIEPMVKTKWAQNQPYNQLLPNQNYATGCVATAMAQIMNYWQYPEVGHGTNTYTFLNPYLQDETLTMDFAEEPFQWNEMLDSYSGSYTKEQAHAVAYLMKACGYSTDMVYSSSSGTQTEKVAIALPQYFGYDAGIQSLQRYEYTATEWASILYNQLKEVGPVLYSANAYGGMGHAFVADGYDGNGYFHINWGWSGLSDGYFSLDALNPPIQSTGGTTTGGYNFSQSMIVNIKKDVGSPSYEVEPRLTLLGNLSASNQDNLILFSMSQANPGNIINNSLLPILPLLGVRIEDTKSGDTIFEEIETIYLNNRADTIATMPPGSSLWNKFSADFNFDSSLPSGKYKVTLVWKEKYDSNAEWQDFISAEGCHDYVYIMKDDNGDLSIENMPLYRIMIESARVVTPLYMRNPCEIEFTLSNPSDYELTQSIIPLLYYVEEDSGARSLIFKGDTQLVSVGPNQKLTTTLVYTFESQSQKNLPTTSTPKDYILGAFDYMALVDQYVSMGNYDEAYYGDLGEATMKRQSGPSSLKLNYIGIDNAEEETEGEGSLPIYGIKDFGAIELKVSAQPENGFYAVPLSVVVSEYDPSDKNKSDIVYEKNFEKLLYAEKGEESVVSTTLNMNDCDKSSLYKATVYYIMSGSRLALGSVYFGASSGITSATFEGNIDIVYDGLNIEIESEEGIASAVVYDLGGKIVASGCGMDMKKCNLNVRNLEKGIYIVTVKSLKGMTKNLKIHR